VSLPAHLTPITVTGTYVGPDGSPAAGTVSFVLSAAGRVPIDGALVPRVGATVSLVSGALSVVILSTDDPDWAQTGLTYQVTERLYGAPVRQYYVAVPAASAGGAVKLADLTPATTPDEVVTTVSSQLDVSNGGTLVGSRPAINLVGAGTTSLTVTDNAGADRVDITITGGGMAFRGPWAASTAYAVGDVVTFAGGSFTATTAHTSGTSFALTSWANMDAAGSVHNVKWYGALGDNATDDTAAINAAVSAAYAAGVANGTYYAEIYFPPGRYKVSSATTKTSTNKGNSQIPLPLHATTATKFVIVFRGTRAATALPHWQQTSTQTAGSVLVSTLAGQTFDATWGAPSVLGGPTPAQGYGNGGIFNNVMVVLDGLSVVVPSNPTVMGFDFSGLAEANVISASVNASTVPGTALPTLATSSWAVGLYLPQTQNNDKCFIQDYSVEGMYIGTIPSEHAVVSNYQAIYCAIGIDVLNNADNVWIGYASIELCPIMLQAEPGGTATHIQVAMLDIEPISTGPFAQTQTINDPNNLFLGTINVHVLNPAGGDQPPIVNGATNCRILDQSKRPGNVTAPSVPSSTVAQTNTFWRDAAVTVSGGTVTVIKVDAVTVGITSGTVVVPAGRTISITYSVAPTWVWTLL
jgi:hypothetical protein